MPLSSKQVLQLIAKGEIKISPFRENHAKGASYDVSLGEFYYRMDDVEKVRNLYSETSAVELWGEVKEAIRFKDAMDWDFITYKTYEAILKTKTIHKDEKIILLHPHETILGHTHEFVGTNKSLVCEIRGRSTIRRNGLSVSADGNWGDPGYKGRWSLYIQNHTSHSIPLVVGRRIAQIIFFEVQGESEDYALDREGGKYAVEGDDMATIMKKWKPESILPQQHKDREVTSLNDLFPQDGLLVH